MNHRTQYAIVMNGEYFTGFDKEAGGDALSGPLNEAVVFACRVKAEAQAILLSKFHDAVQKKPFELRY